MRSETQYKQIHETMNQRETDELVGIWVKNDRVEWSNLTFEVIEDILQERSIEPPVQNDPVCERPAQKSPHNKLREFMVGNDEAGAENGPIFYRPQSVIAFHKWIYLTMYIAIISGIANSAIALTSISATNRIAYIIYAILAIAFQIALTVAALKGLSYILKILMQFEFNSRAARIKNTETAA
jgi:hypothetical protein